MMLSSVDLPQPDGPSRQTNSPSRDVEIDVVEHVDCLPSRVKVMLTCSTRELGCRRRSPSEIAMHPAMPR